MQYMQDIPSQSSTGDQLVYLLVTLLGKATFLQLSLESDHSLRLPVCLGGEEDSGREGPGWWGGGGWAGGGCGPEET